MEAISLQMSFMKTITNQMAPNPCKARSTNVVSYKLKPITCSVNEVATMQRRTKTNLYQVLSLSSPNVGFDEIKKAYRTMALRYHPDVCSPSVREESTRRFVELQKAYEILSDPVSRQRYDYELSFVDSVECGVGGFCREDGASRFPRQVWEDQLYRLQIRSRDRRRRR